MSDERRAPAWKLTTAQIGAILGAAMLIENRLTKVETEVRQLRSEVAAITRPTGRGASDAKPGIAAIKEPDSDRVQDGFGARARVEGALHRGEHGGEGGGPLLVLESPAGAHVPSRVEDRTR